MKPVQGDEKLVKKFKRAKDTIETKASKQAMRKSGNIVLKQARANLRPVSRIMARALGQKVIQYKKDGNVIAIIGVRDADSVRQKNKQGRLHDPRNTMHLVELGTQPHQVRLFGTGVLVQHPGTKARNPLNKAIESKKSAVESEFKATFQRVIRDATK